jgi:transposase
VIEIGPVYHRLPERIRAHASICFIALILHRIMRTRLRAASTSLSPERALEQLRRIQHHRIRINGATSVTGVSSINNEQDEVLHALRVKKPIAPQQLTLL